MPSLPPDAASNEFLQARLQKLETLRDRGMDPFSQERYEATHHAQDVLDHFEELEDKPARLAGRIVSIRVMGKASFMHLEDSSGRIQLYFRLNDLGEEAYKAATELLDLGDFVGVSGEVFRTRAGEISIHVEEYVPLAKALRPPPLGKSRGDEEWGGLEDVELRYRRRYLDLIANPEVRKVFVARSRIVAAVRRFLDGEGYLEVETPVLQSVAGGAAAKPFESYYNALDHTFHLRISLELYLKRLLVGGFEKVYEIGRVFRNEGLSTRHNPEFTLMESYAAYQNLEDVMALVEGIFGAVAQDLHGGLAVTFGDTELDFTAPWRRVSLLEGLRETAGVKPEELETLESAKAAGERLGLDMAKEDTVGGIIEKMHERFLQPTCIQPTFVTDYPIETSPLAKKIPGNPRLTRRFEAFVAGQEVGNAFSEINDPLDQRERLESQLKMRAAGDAEAHEMDEDFLLALEHGMPPAGGLGIGIDRLVMLFTNSTSIRDVLLFPQMKPQA
ncbi:MAG TPA: lysine--tRNA ligase [Armatimonadota bacterium]